MSQSPPAAIRTSIGVTFWIRAGHRARAAGVVRPEPQSPRGAPRNPSENFQVHPERAVGGNPTVSNRHKACFRMKGCVVTSNSSGRCGRLSVQAPVLASPNDASQQQPGPNL